MPKYTETFFLIPVRVYHEDLEDFDSTGDFGIGWARVPWEDFGTATWHEGYPKGTLGMATVTEGFELTIVTTISHKYICTWPMKQFEKELNKFMTKIDELFKDNPDKEEDSEL